jgi:ABC-2 type transport system ATP-binding protein
MSMAEAWEIAEDEGFTAHAYPVRAANKNGRDALIEVDGLSKHYPPDLKAVDNISLSIQPGQIFSLLGPNGAGKTTAVEILEGLREPTSGSVRIFGTDISHDYDKIRKRVGILPQNFEPFEMLRPLEALEYWAHLFNKKKSSKEMVALLESVGLGNKKGTMGGKMSGGEKRKLGIAMSIINDPELLFLDEPTTGLDPKARRDLWELIKGIKAKGTTVVLTTHYLDEAEKLSDDVAIMNRGRIVARGSPDELIERYGKGTLIVLVGVGDSAVQELAMRNIVSHRENGNVVVPVANPRELRTVFAKLSSIQIEFKDMYTRRQTLEDVFLNLVGQKMDEGVLRQ